MIDDAMKRKICEACGWKPLVHPTGNLVCDDGECLYAPWARVDDAIAALEAFCATGKIEAEFVRKRGTKCWIVNLWVADRSVHGAVEDDLPTAACLAICAAWDKMQESK